MAADRRGYQRDEIEFGRVVAFSDGIFGIAMTLLVAGITVPRVAQGDLAQALLDDIDDIVAFAVSFAVIGFYWLAHHSFFHLLSHIDHVLLRINLAYLGLIAFMPFPTALLGASDTSATAVALYALALATASGVEALMFRHARRTGALRVPMPDGVYRDYLKASTAPVVVFLVSIPVAFVQPAVAVLLWIAIFVVERLIDRTLSPEMRAWAQRAMGAEE